MSVAGTNPHATYVVVMIVSNEGIVVVVTVLLASLGHIARSAKEGALSSQGTKLLGSKRIDLNHLVADLVGAEHVPALPCGDDAGLNRSVQQRVPGRFVEEARPDRISDLSLNCQGWKRMIQRGIEHSESRLIGRGNIDVTRQRLACLSIVEECARNGAT